MAVGSPKTLVKYGVLAKIENVYGTPVVLAGASDGIDIIVAPEPNVDYAHGGERGGKSPATLGGRARVGKMGRFGTVTVAVEPAGRSTAFSASNLPNIHTLARLGGWTPTVDTTPGSENVIYVPTAHGSEESATLEAYYRGQKYPFAGVIGNSKWSSDVPGISRFEVECQGLLSAIPSDAAVPSITYGWPEPPKSIALNLTAVIGGDTFTVGKIKSFELLMERSINPRANDNVTGLHGGFNVGVERKLTLKAMIESEPLKAAAPYLGTAGFHIFELMERASAMALAFTIGSTQYNTFDFAAATAQLVNSPEQAEGSASMWECEWELKPSSLTTNDECSITVS